MKNKIWFITGTSKGFGRIWGEAALKRGDKIVATARNIDSVADLAKQYGDAVLPLSLDVNNRENCFDAVQKAVEHFGRIDILVNNAGFGLFGYLEEISEEEARKQVETNLFGSLWMIQAVLPVMRKQKSGHILQVSSIGGKMAFPFLSMYHATKWGVEGMCESLAQEVASFGINITIVEPQGYATDWGSASATFTQPMEAYQPQREAMKSGSGKVPIANPEHTPGAILKLVDAEKPPLRLFLGKFPFQIIDSIYNKRLAEWKEWQEISESAN